MTQNKAGPKSDLKEKIAEFPLSPGVYLMKDKDGAIIYVGKAVLLRNRVRSYFGKNQNIKTKHLVRKIFDIDFILTSNEYEALLLENSLIKKWQPVYNINLKDGKTYPVIRITRVRYPRVFRTRYIKNDGSSYFGPYPDVKSIDLYLDLIEKLFPLRKCRGPLKSRKNPCLYYHIKKCQAPCCGLISREDYQKNVNKIKMLLSGKTVGLRKELYAQMQSYSSDLEFEKAGEYRDLISIIETLEKEQKIVDFIPETRDFVSYASEDDKFSFAVIQMRDGRISGREIYRSRFSGSENEAVEQFFLQYYDNKNLPETIFTEIAAENSHLTRYFAEEKKQSLKIKAASDNREGSVLRMARENALQDLNRRLDSDGNKHALERLKSLLNLPTLPVRIEGFDIAQLHGTDTVASLICFINGKPDKKQYKRFKMKTLDGKIDDFKAISEAVARRYTRVLNEKLERPDLILIDGGKGQVSAAYGVLKSIGLQNIPLAGLAKREEIIYLPGDKDGLDLPEGDPALRILQAVRDETHRFATGYNQTLRAKKVHFGVLESIHGIGPAKSRRLMKAYGSLENIAQAEIEEIASFSGLSHDICETLKAFLLSKFKPK